MLKFFESFANRAGVATLLATILTAAAQSILTHTAPPLADILGAVVGLGLIVAPDNTVTVAQLEKAIADVSAALATKSPAAVVAAAEDAAGIVDSVTAAKKV